MNLGNVLILRWLALPAKYRFIEQIFKNKTFTLLDIGAGNHSASKTKKWYPLCKYYGIDLDINYNNNQQDFSCMEAFYELNLELLQFDDIPDNFFDFIMCAHVIEHLKNGDEVLKKLSAKLKPGGYIYVEYPGIKSTKLPSMKGTLNFYDDPTHVRVYSIAELQQVFKTENMQIVKSGTRKHLPTMLIMPVKVIYSLLKHKYV